MKIIQVTAHKEFKFGLPNFSNITAGAGLTVEVGEGEMVDWNELWDTINQQIFNQSNMDQSWIDKKEFRNHFKITIKQPKEQGGKQI